MDLLPGWISTEEAAEVTGYCADYVCKLARRERIKATKVGRDWRINLESLLAFKTQMDRLGEQKHNPCRDNLAGAGRGR